MDIWFCIISIDYVGISLLAEDRYQDGILCYNKCILDEAKTTVIYSHEDKAIVVTPYFYGQGNIRFKVIDDVNNVIYTSFALDKDVPELYFFDVDITDIMSQIDEEDVEAEFGEYNITKKDLETIMQVVFGVFKVTPAINSIKSTLTPDEKMEALEYRRFDNYVMFNCPKTINGVRSFLPVKGKDNMVVRYVQKVCECDEESAKALLEVVFNNLAVAGELFKKHT